MTFKQALVRARSHIVFTVGLIVSLGVVLLLEQWERDAWERVARSGPVPAPVARRPLTEEEHAWAKGAWRYFERNTRPNGLVDAVEGQAESDAWNTGAYVSALIAAERIGIIPRAEAVIRLDRALAAVMRIALSPGTRVSTETLEAVPAGGTSGLGLARLVAALRTAAGAYPERSAEIHQTLTRLPTQGAVRDGNVVYTFPSGTVTAEARVGDAGFAARALALVGVSAPDAATAIRRGRLRRVEGVAVIVDDPDTPPPPTRHENVPFALEGLVFGFTPDSHHLAAAVARAAARRAVRTGSPTAVAHVPLDRDPGFVWTHPSFAGGAWVPVDGAGDAHPDRLVLATSAAFAADALFRTEEASAARRAVAGLLDEDRGWRVGRYERTGEPNDILTCATNAAVLESLCFIQLGPLLHAGPSPGSDS